MNTDTSTKEPITQKTRNIIGEIHPFFRFGKELDPFMHQEGEHTAECPFYYLIDVDEQKQLYFLVQEAKPGEKTKTLYTDTITNEINAKKILNEKKYPLFKILQSAIRQKQYKIVGSIETVAYDMISKLYQELANIFLNGEVETYWNLRKEEQHFQKHKDLQARVNPEILKEIEADPIKTIIQACEEAGIVGEIESKLALYLFGLMGIEAGGAFILGNPSVGKSHLMNNTAKKLYPKRYVYDISAFSDKGLLYLYKHQKEEIDEAELLILHEGLKYSSEFKDFFMRMVTNPDDEVFTFATVDTNQNSLILTFPKMSIWQTTIHSGIDPANLTRSILMSVEESQEKTVSLLKYKARNLARGGRTENKELLETFSEGYSKKIIEQRRQIDGVICPFFYPEILPLPTNKPSIVRHQERLVLFSHIIAIINKRPVVNIKDKSLVIIEPADMVLAIRILTKIFPETLSEIDDRFRKFYWDVVKDIQDSGLEYTTIKRMDKKREDLSKESVRQYLKNLCDKNYLSYERDPENKRSYQYFLTTQSIDSVIDFNLSKIVEIWEREFLELSLEIQEAIIEMYPEYQNGQIFLEHLKDLCFLDEKLIDTEHSERYRMFGIKSRKRQLKLGETAKRGIPNNRTQSKHIKNNSPESAKDPDYQKVWHSCSLLTHMDEIENFTIDQVYNKLQEQREELDEQTIKENLEQLLEEGYLIMKDEETFEISKKQQEEKLQLIIQPVLEACKDLEQIHKGTFNRNDLTKYLKLKDEKVSEELVEKVVSKFLQDGILFEPTTSMLRLVRGG